MQLGSAEGLCHFTGNLGDALRFPNSPKSRGVIGS
jgi:hypothetical protein